LVVSQSVNAEEEEEEEKEEDGPEKKEARNGNSCMNAEQEQKRYQIGKRQTLRNRTV
jgi:hypothetical protein